MDGLFVSFLVEDILNEHVPESPRGATLARIVASRALADGEDAKAACMLYAARFAVDSGPQINWRDALRANTELALHLVATGRFDEALPVLRRAFELLDRYFGSKNLGGSELQYLIGICAYRAAEFDAYHEHLTQSEATRNHFSERDRATSLRALEALVEAGQAAYMRSYDAAATASV